MRRRSILERTTLTTISIVAVLVTFTNVQAQTQGALQVLDDEGKPNGECPLKHTEVKAKVSGFLSRVTVTQDFENNFTEKIEAVYTFPLPQDSAVDDLTMLIGERTIKGKIMTREDAKSAYAAAKQTGKIASLLDQKRPNIFTQQVANILPGQRIRIIISYVETLKYEDGAYEWSFPMVVAPRYNPAVNEEQADTNELTDASHIPPPSAPGVRAGHDISLEIDLDAGVPIVGVNSDSHETEVQQINEQRAVVRLKDRATIPNKDFLLSYRVAGSAINDAVLAHRSERGGFFTLILQPPQRVAAEDVMPKELVFVLDVSTSMDGFPLETAKQTMDLALNNLYPHDTFNLISFSDDTRTLFPEPVPATPENLRKARKFIASRKVEGGTEMLKATQVALEPSDSQQHVRIAVFMTDGQVSNEMQILAEVQKHPNARVFAMGFGIGPNRFLLDKMAEYGRGEVDYIPGGGETSSFAQRLNKRIRNPLLTDISIDWSGLSITDVYPKRIPDLFSIKPLILSGRYTQGGKGIIRLKGKMAGADFVREIPVELPETETEHDVLSTLWARRRIEDLMSEKLNDQPAQDQQRQEITQLGLDFKLMTQYTSFVAIDEVVFTGTEEPKRVDVPVEIPPGTMSSGISASVTVTAGAYEMNGCSVDVGNCITTRSIQELPIQGRSFATLLTLNPGVAGPSTSSTREVFVSNYWASGQRSSSNSFIVDGVNANFGIAPGGESPGPSAAGNTPALTASGGANGLATLGSTQEVKIQTPAMAPEHGRVAGAQVEVTTRSGTNEFHGSLFHFFSNDELDANDWFANSLGLKQPAKRLNSFGGTFGGPIKRDQAFFFASYEGMRLRQPMVGITDVPSLSARAVAPAALRSFFDGFPVPNGATRPDGFAEFVSSFANPARHDAGSFRTEWMPTSKTTLYGRYSFSDSDAAQRGAGGFSLNTTNLIRSRSQTITGALTQILSSTAVLELRANYSRVRVNGSYLLDEFGGARPADLFPTAAFTFDLNSRNAAWMAGDEQSSLQRQFNVNGSSSVIRNNHSFKFGGDYRRLSPRIDLRTSEENTLFNGVAQALTGIATRVSRLSFIDSQNPVFQSLSLFAQDDWRRTSRLTLTYGLRWELAPPPSTNDPHPFAVDQINDPTTLKLAAPGSSLWKTTFLNFAPRAGVAYQLSDANNREMVLRGGVGIFYDLGQDSSGDIFANSIPFVSGSSALPLLAYDPHLKLPYVINWNVTLQRNLGSSQTLSATYLGSSGQRLLHTATLLDQNPDFSFLRLTTNRGSSDYRALQVKFDRSPRNGVAALVSYTLSRSMDNVAEDSTRRAIIASSNPEDDRGPSDFDIRHQLTGHLTYELPSPVSKGLGNKFLRNWALDSIFNARSAKPLNVVYMVPTSLGMAYLRPDVVSGTSLYIFDPLTAGGRSLNRAAFIIPSNSQQGSLDRNSLRGFALYQVDLALRRKFSFNENVALQIQADAFNVFNHTNFEDPSGNDLVAGNSLAFGQSTSLTGRGLAGGGFPSFYSFGGSRAMRFSVKLLF